MAVEFRLLGAVEVRIDGHLVEVGHARQRCVLMALLVDANRSVSVDQLVDRVWAGHLPQGAHRPLYGYLSRLRRALAATSDVQIGRQSGGYVLTVDPMTIDLYRFQHLVGQARKVDNDKDALALLEEALQLWRGEAFATLDTPWLNSVRDALDRQRLAAELDRNDLALRHDDHGRLLADLSAGAVAQPLDERLAGQLMLALYRSGRQADALEHYQQLRLMLAENLGTDPSPVLQHLHQQILMADPALDPPPTPTAGSVSAPAVVMHTLPRDTTAFTDRDEVLHRLLQNTNEAVATGRAIAIHAIDGMPGVGKTAFAVHAAHLLADRFPDGQRFLRLHAHTPGQRPVEPIDALGALLAGTGVAAQLIPTDTDARAAMWRDRLAGRRELLILDDAAGHEQVEPLLPGAEGCLVLITSRRCLAALADAVSLPLDTLPAEQAAELFTRLAARSTLGTQADAVAQVVQLCGYLPLAVALLAGRLRHHPAWSIADLAADVEAAQDRLTELHAEDLEVAAAFALSYQKLPADRQRMFRRLGLHPGTDIDAYAAACLNDVALPEARRQLDALYTDRLVDEPVRGRYRMHDLIRDYATRLATTEDAEVDRREAQRRLFDYYLASAAAAMDVVHPAEQHRRPRVRAPATPTVPMADTASACAWLNAERPNLVAVCTHTASHGWDDYTIRLGTTLFRYLDTGGHYADAFTIHTHARDAARRTGDHAGEARALDHLGLSYWRQGQLDRAVDHLQQALTLFRHLHEPLGQARAMANLAVAYWRQGQLDRAVDHLQQALTLFQHLHERLGEARALENLGLIYERQGQLARAFDHLQQALTLFRQIDDRAGEADVLANLGVAYWRQGTLDRAIDHLQQALTLFRQIGYPTSEAGALANLGLAYGRQGQSELAIDHLQQAIALYRQIGDRPGLAEALNGLGEALQATGEAEQASIRHTCALAVAVEIADRYEQARAHDGLATIGKANGDLDAARWHWQRAVALYTELRLAEAETMRAHLATIPAGPPTPDAARTRTPPPS